MDKSNVETLFEWFNNTSEMIVQHSDELYIDSLAIVMESLFYQSPPEDLDDTLAKKIEKSLEKIDLSTHKTDEIRKAIQLAILKGMKDSTQQQHLMTPETVGLIVGYLADKLMEGKKEVSVFDPAGGTGNLLTTVLEKLNQDVKAFASEVDPTLIQLAVLNANLQKKQIEFFHQDSLRPFLLDPVDLVVADLPIGYYPDDVQASGYKLKADEGHSYAHHLFIEQGLKYTKEAGYNIYIIPEFLFDSEQSKQLNRFLHDHAHIIGLIRLPESAFKSNNNAKSILILQKKGKETSGVKQPLLVQMPSFKNANQMADILGQMNLWFKKNHNKQ
ncbi:class I SAM-dependent methyltransferase [Oceanobacillus bengalensis]|uniref:Class I SAM-dependent methyltransferase n=1 Tax=Oceanobacillus bengalensis TaxID=1435466 RepID=A0A494YWN8_9BACI|nr:class I SAM-dependent methyltransferase [Oceanobacillus bengalensis]RKQ14637.1 class I SAM-dependent methyltransferase [Oceanobacillus bengalensis]